MIFNDITPKIVADEATIDAISYKLDSSDNYDLNVRPYRALYTSDSFNACWQSANLPFPHYWQIYYSKTIILSELSFIPVDDAICQIVKSYELYCSNDGKNYIKVGSGTCPNEGAVAGQKHSRAYIKLNNPQKCKYVKLVILDSYDYRGYKWTGFWGVKLTGAICNAYNLYMAQDGIYGVKNNVFTKITDNFNSITDTEKVALFKATDYNTPTVNELSSIGKFKVLSYAESNEHIKCSIIGVPKNQMVLPNGLINLESFEGIDKATLGVNIKSINQSINMRFNERGINGLNKELWSNSGVTFDEPGVFGNKSAKIGKTNYLTAQDNEKWNFGADDFTIALWVKPYALLERGAIIAQRSDAGQYGPIQIGLSPTGFYIYASKATGVWDIDKDIAFPVEQNVWYHVALIRKGNTLTFYVNGTDLYTTTLTGSFSDFSNPMRIGNSGSSGLYGATCYLDDIVFVKKALWSSNFTLPSTYLLDYLCIKLLVTNDNKTFLAYDFTTQVWQIVDHTNLAKVKLFGIDVANLKDIDRTAWDKITAGKIGIGFAYMLSIEDTTDTCEVDKLELQVDMKGSWNKAIHGTDYNYGYPKNNILRVSLLTNGDYKINYSEGEKKI